MILILSAFIIILLYSITNFVLSHIRYKRRMSDLSKWRKLIDQSIVWSKEISCETTREKFLIFYADSILNVKREDICSTKIEEVKTRIINQFGNNIPSIREETRNSRLKELGI